MADEDAGRSRTRERSARERSPRDSADERAADDSADEHSVRERETRRDESGSGLGFSLPPISLPEMRLPDRVRLVFPVPDPPEKVPRPTRVRVSWVLLAVVLADALDALAVVWAGPETLAWARAAVGLLAAVVLVGGPGLLYAWELLAVLGGVGWLSLAPTLTALVLARVVLSQ